MITRLAKTIRPTPRGALKSGAVPMLLLVVCLVQAWRVSSIGDRLHTLNAPRGGISLQLAPTAATAATIRDEWNREGLAPVFEQSLQRDSYLILAYVATLLAATIWAGWIVNLGGLAFGILVSLFLVAGLCDLAENNLLAIPFGFREGLPFHGLIDLLAVVLDRMLDWSVAVEAGITGRPPRMSLAEYLRVDNYVHAVTLGRLFAMSKFSLLLLGVTGLAAVIGGAFRLFVDFTPSPASRQPQLSFKDLVDLETESIFAQTPRRTQDDPECTVHASADEQFVYFRAADVIGLALSGGGIRSATFNLGLLQGMQRIGVLRLFDYMATVSGGGYVGSFWSEWLARQTDEAHRNIRPPLRARVPEAQLFPTNRADDASQRTLIDTDQERHLREFSRFLAPRLGFFEIEMWTAIVALFGGLIPALVIGLSVLGVAILCWLALTFALASYSVAATASVIALVTTLVFIYFEWLWLTFRKESAGKARVETDEERDVSTRAVWRYGVFAALTVILVFIVQVLVPTLYATRVGTAWPIYTQLDQGGWHAAPDVSGIVRWWAVTGISIPGTTGLEAEHPWIFSPRLFDFALVWLATGLLLLLLRLSFAISPRKPETHAAFDRVVMRVLALGVFWTTIAAIWHVAINVSGLVGITSGAVVSGGAFAALRNWIGVTLRRPTEATLTDRLKPFLPQVLAYVTVALSAVAVGGLLIKFAGDDWVRWWLAAAGINTFVVLALFVRPEEFGLHAFYRDRICRAYSGACNLAAKQDARDNRGTEPRDGDDRNMSGLVDRPLHLVCCAANDLSGDQVETLNRGARSAVISKHGFALGRYFHRWTDQRHVRLGSAITASAAAFNSNMGQISVRVGPAVSFLMTMLNLRLGLWLRHPAAHLVEARRWPGILLYREMLGFTSSSGRITDTEGPSTYLRDVHLSDGAHFENLALYELVRRHCRYILVSDCGSDPEVAFDDLGNAQRRIREDFGVDIELDVSALRPDAKGCSAQHVAVGTIHYSPTDRGILLYVKPSVTGDEPTDVQQYMTRNKAFPHETTGDQFYDEAQWESYRRLGLHAADCIFDFVAREDVNKRDADWVFGEASHRWGPTPEGLEDAVVEMTKRFGVLESELHDRAARKIVQDIFPELRYLPEGLRAMYQPPAQPAAAQPRLPNTRGQQADRPGEEFTSLSDVPFLMRVLQLMEDTWLTCQLDQWWTHPLNLGWINLFARWATSPAFRLWWPLLSPMFSPGFRRFIDERFPVRARTGAHGPLPLPPEGEVSELAGLPEGLAAEWWRDRSAQPMNWGPSGEGTEHTFYTNAIYLPDLRDQNLTVRLDVGLIKVTRNGQTVGWTSDDFFVPPSLWGAGLGWYFLKNLLLKLCQTASWCYVIVKMPPEGSRHQVALDDRQAFLEQYRKIGFREQRDSSSEAAALDQLLRKELGFKPEDEDTLLSLNLEQWRDRQLAASNGVTP